MTIAHAPSAATIAKGVAEGSISAVEVVRTALAQIGERDGEIGAFTNVTAERALSEAQAIDRARMRGERLGPLAGVPYGAKNLFDIADLPTLAGSKINRTRPAAEEDAALVKRMTAAGAIMLGGLNMGEYAYDFTGENAHYGPSRNPLDTTRMSGGSSGGSAAAVAAGFMPIALGSDTNGSIRVPSAFCGLYGLKPTYGRLPRTGTFPFCESLDHLGPFARSAEDLALCYDAVQGPDADDPACAGRPIERALTELSKGADGIRVAIAGGYFRSNAEPGALAAVDRVASLLNTSKMIDVPFAGEARGAAFLITNAESSAFHLDRLRRQAADFDPDTRDRFLAGAMLPAAWYIGAQRFRRKFAETFAGIFKHCDAVLAPSTPCSAPLLGQKTLRLGSGDVPLRPNIGIYTQPISFIGLPVAAVPVYGAGPMPYGVQIIAKPWREDICLRLAAVLEREMAAQPGPSQ